VLPNTNPRTVRNEARISTAVGAPTVTPRRFFSRSEHCPREKKRRSEQHEVLISQHRDRLTLRLGRSLLTY